MTTKLYALRSPRGALINETATTFASDDWTSEAFDYLRAVRSRELRAAMVWGEWIKARDNARALGWEVVEVQLVEKPRQKARRKA